MINRMPIPDQNEWKGANITIEEAQAALEEFAAKRGATVLSPAKVTKWRFTENWAFYATIDIPEGQDRWTRLGGRERARRILYKGKRHVGFSRWTGRWSILGLR